MSNRLYAAAESNWCGRARSIVDVAADDPAQRAIQDDIRTTVARCPPPPKVKAKPAHRHI
jgi:hypothetical protein